MKIYKQFFWIFLFSALGELVSLLLEPIILIPGSVLGMILLFLALQLSWLKLEDVEDVGNFLTDNMALFFVPAGVGMMTNFDLIGQIWWQLLLIIIVSVAGLLIIVGKTVAYIKGKTDQDQTRSQEHA